MFGWGSSSNPEAQKAKTEKKVEEIVREFVQKQPNTIYTFDSERGAPQSTLCRENGPQRKECIQVQMYATKLFEAMQANGFYCALPSDPTQTHMECKPMPKA
ncbi:hypothetical protein OE88DRAFT_1732458 [Heliocybe sulcata]|uniref:Uncharacterized protein n=1 Tax=Heliocybe sulcata TaxID=5364 RepID=A0A5C3NFD8_9AGAM|nr:hypothetical protein OE88DRAFT_1732458 [Heliocybe sulcata]